MVDSEHARNRAEAAFKRKEDARAEGLKATEEYEAGQRAMREKTARLRALRLARDQATAIWSAPRVSISAVYSSPLPRFIRPSRTPVLTPYGRSGWI